MANWPITFGPGEEDNTDLGEIENANQQVMKYSTLHKVWSRFIGVYFDRDILSAPRDGNEMLSRCINTTSSSLLRIIYGDSGLR